MKCGHRCFEIGGPWIDADPNCPFHGYEAQAKEKRAHTEESLITSKKEELFQLIHDAEDLYDIKNVLLELAELI